MCTVLLVLDYVSELYITLTTTPRAELARMVTELKQSTPEPMHSMLDKEPKEAATQKYWSRKEKETVICPPTCSGKSITGS